MSSSPRANSSKRSEWPEEKSTAYNFLILQRNQNVTVDCSKVIYS